MPATPLTPLDQHRAVDQPGGLDLRPALDQQPLASLRRLPARITEPPFDDELATEMPARHEAVQGTLALAFALPSGLPAVPGAPRLPGVPSLSRPDRGRRLRLVPPLDDPAADDDSTDGRRRAGRPFEADDFGPLQTSRAHLPEPNPWAARLVQAIVEVTVGARPVGQLLRWTSADVYESIRHRVARAGSGRGGPAPVVRSVHVDEPTDGVAEVCAVVQHGARCRAVAVRLEGLDGRWQCTALQVC